MDSSSSEEEADEPGGSIRYSSDNKGVQEGLAEMADGINMQKDGKVAERYETA